MIHSRLSVIPFALAAALSNLPSVFAQAAAPAAPAAQTAPAAPAAPAGPKPGDISFSGLIDWYYGINFQHPSPNFTIGTTLGGITGAQNAGRAFDYHNQFGLSLAELNFTRVAGKGFPLGITATITAGDTPPVVYATEPGARAGFEGIQQLYLTYAPHVWGRDITVDFGKFVTPFGIEVIESPANDNYSRGFVFTYAIPLYHTGIRASVPLSNNLTILGELVNGWNNSTDDNGAKSLIAQLTWKPGPKWTHTFGFMGGSEGTGAYGVGLAPRNGGGNITTNLVEYLGVFQATDKLKLAGEVDYASAAGDVLGVHTSGNWLGVAAYARYQFTPSIATAVRVEQFEDMPGSGPVKGLRFGAGYTKMNSATFTLEYAALHSHLVSRLEFRHDHSNHSLFVGNNRTVFDQDTLFFGQAYKF